MAEPLFRFKYDEGEFDLTRITRSELSHFKQWYGDEYGQKLTVVAKAIWRDGDAVACLSWACRRENGLQPNPDPRNMPDFDPDEIIMIVPDKELENPKLPLDPKTSSPSGPTEETPTNSGDAGSPS